MNSSRAPPITCNTHENYICKELFVVGCSVGLVLPSGLLLVVTDVSTACVEVIFRVNIRLVM